MNRAAVVLGLGVTTLPLYAVAQTRNLSEELPPVEYRLSVGPFLHPEDGITAITTAARLTLRAGDGLGAFYEPKCGKLGWLCAIGRGVELFFLQLPVASYANILVHELFGHGARARELGLADTYSLAPPPPYSFFAGATRYETRVSSGAPPLTADERALVTVGGFEAEEAQLRSLAFTAFRGSLQHGDALVYALGPLHLLTSLGTNSADFTSLLAHWSNRYGAVSENERSSTLGHAIVSTALDPLFVWSIYALFYRFLVRGDRAVAYPALLRRGAMLSFTTRLLLVPWGREHLIDLFVGTQYFHLDVGFRIGEGPGGNSSGLTLTLLDWFPVRWLRAGVSVDVFVQPPLQLRSGGVDPLGPVPTDGVVGGGFQLLAEVFVSKQFFVGLRMGGKSRGLIAERPYAAAFEGVLTAGVVLTAPGSLP